MFHNVLIRNLRQTFTYKVEVIWLQLSLELKQAQIFPKYTSQGDGGVLYATVREL